MCVFLQKPHNRKNETQWCKGRKVVYHLLKGCQLPVGRGFFKISLCPLPRTIIKNAKRRGKNFSLTYYSNLKGSKWPKTEPVKQKKQQIFFKTYCFRWPPVGGRYSVFMARPADSQTGT